MIEYCTKKRMLLACGFLIGVSVVIVVVENKFSVTNGPKEIAELAENSSYKACWKETQTEVIEECAPCNKYETKVHDYCLVTGYKERVKCIYSDKDPEEVYRSCPKLDWLEERNFWAFEIMTFIIGTLSYTVVYMRQKRLDQNLADKVNKQIAAGV